MLKYIVKRENIYYQTVEVEAENEDQAWEIAQELDDTQWGDEHFVFNDCIEVILKEDIL